MALSTVVNICRKLPSESLSPCMEALPTLCNLLNYEDHQVPIMEFVCIILPLNVSFLIVSNNKNLIPQLVESVATSLIKIVEHACHSSKLLDELCKPELIQQVSHLLTLNGRTTLSQPVYNVRIFSPLACTFLIFYLSLVEDKMDLLC